MESPTIRQRMTLSDQLSVLQSSNLRDLLRFRDDEIASRRRSSTVTLASVLEAEKAASASAGRTLLDVIREEEDSRGSGSSRWRDLTDRIGIRPLQPAPASISANARSESSGASGSGTIRVSLMTLMELREREEEGEDEESRSAAAVAGGGDDVAEVEEERERHVCCVCMVRKKGAAFIPCGHTFCRVCSRELLMGRGNCPLCNGTILEVLDIF